MIKKKILASVFAYLLIFTCTYGAFAYSLTGAKLVNGIHYYYHQDFGSLTISQMKSACTTINNEIGRSVLTISDIWVHNLFDCPNFDGVSRIYRDTLGTETNYLAINFWNLPIGPVSESDVVINASHPFANSAQPGKYDVWSVFLHEMGHTVGLNHSAQTSAVMYAHTSPGVAKRALTQDDKNGIAAMNY